jgi:FMN-dependent oxidoreductase (nitrilotriacetate monooxygenase family)
MERFHLGWFLGSGFGPQTPGWGGPWAGHGYDWKKPGIYLDLVRSLERGGFDMLIIEDSSMVPDIYKGTAETYLKLAMFAPKHDPVPLVPLLAQATEHIGIVPTLTTTFYPPFLLARLMATLDHLTDGRVGWNIVTSTSERSAQNYGHDHHFEHDLRYDMADEFVELVCKLWDSWEPDAVVMDHETGVFADHTKVHRVDFKGQFYASRGPLNAVSSPQRRPVFVQAGGSPKGRDFAAKRAETVIASVKTVADMKKYFTDVKDRMISYGRKPDDCKLLFTAQPIIGDTEDEARARAARMKAAAADHVEGALAAMSNLTHIDFSQFDLDQPLPELDTNGSKSTLAGFVQGEGRPTLRQLATGSGGLESVELVGTAEQVADRMGEVMDEVGGDGFLLSGGARPRYVAEIVDGLVPALQRRGLVRTEYSFDHFRDNLLEF